METTERLRKNVKKKQSRYIKQQTGIHLDRWKALEIQEGRQSKALRMQEVRQHGTLRIMGIRRHAL